jgi:PleD family two-component response regulator
VKLVAVVKRMEVARVLEKSAERNRYVFAAAASLEEAFSGAPDVVFAEWSLDESAGPLLAGIQRAVSQTPQIPVVVSLPRGIPALPARALRTGVVDVLLLPAA